MDDGCPKKVTLDFSKIAFINTPEEMVVWEVVLKCVVVGILLLMAIVGNTLVIVIVFLFPKMRTTTNYYIVNLAIADLLVACFPMWIHVTTDVTDGFILGGFLCKFNAFVQTSAISAISFTMMVIAGDRFFAIVFPLKARVTQRRVKVVVFFIWFFAIPIGIPPAVFYEYTERQWLDYLETFCTDIWPMVKTSEGCDQGATSERIYWTIIVAALNWVPMVMMTINYTLIIHKLRFARVAAHRGRDAISLVQRRSATKVIKMLFSLLIVFMVCTIPFQVATLYENYKDKKTKLQSWYQPVYFSAITLMYGHSSINPIIYGAMNHSFRTGFRHLIDRIRGRKLTTWDYTMNGGTESVMRPGIHVIDRSGSGKDDSNGDVTAKSSQSLQIPCNFDSTPTVPRRRHFDYAVDDDYNEKVMETKNCDVIGNNNHDKMSSWVDGISNSDSKILQKTRHFKNGLTIVIDKSDEVWMGDNDGCLTQEQRDTSLTIEHNGAPNSLYSNGVFHTDNVHSNGALHTDGVRSDKDDVGSNGALYKDNTGPYCSLHTDDLRSISTGMLRTHDVRPNGTSCTGKEPQEPSELQEMQAQNSFKDELVLSTTYLTQALVID